MGGNFSLSGSIPAQKLNNGEKGDTTRIATCGETMWRGDTTPSTDKLPTVTDEVNSVRGPRENEDLFLERIGNLLNEGKKRSELQGPTGSPG
jgi:hypothetical protein